jgi:hypothetical protein
MVPPTIVAPVEPNPPAKNRATITVLMFFDLCSAVFGSHDENGD